MAKPTLYELDAAASAIIDIISDNNPSGVMYELNRLGYRANNINEAKYRYLQLFLLNSNEFWKSIINIPFNYNNANPQIEQQVKQLTESLGGEKVYTQRFREGETGEKKWWEKGLDILIGHQVTGGGTITESAQIPAGFYIAMTFIVLGIFGIMWLAITKIK